MKKSQLKIGALLSYVSLFVTNIIGLLYTPIMLRIMGQAEYGLYSLIASFIGYLTVLDLGFGNAVVVYTAKYRANGKKEEEKKLHGMFLIIYVFIGIIAGIIGIILYFNVNNLFGAKFTLMELEKAKVMMAILTFNLIITFPLSIFGNILTAYEEFIFTKLLNIVRQLLNPLIMLPLLYMGGRSITMTVVVTVLNIICLLANMIFCFKKLDVKIKFNGFDMKLLKEIFGYSFFIFIAVIVDKINWQVDQFVLGAVAGTVAVAIYTIASQINNVYLSFSTAISSVTLPKITKIVETSNSDEEVSNEFVKTGRIQFLVMGLIITGFILFGKEFIYLWAGRGYETSYYIACILMIPVTIPLIQNLGISVLQAKNMHKFRTILYSLISIANIAISIPLARRYGGIGSAIGTGISFIIGNGIIINYYYYKKVGIDIKRFWINILKMSLPMAIWFIISILIKTLVTLEYGWIHLAISALLYTGVYSFVVYVFSMNNYEKGLIKNIFKKLKIVR